MSFCANGRSSGRFLLQAHLSVYPNALILLNSSRVRNRFEKLGRLDSPRVQ